DILVQPIGRPVDLGRYVGRRVFFEGLGYPDVADASGKIDAAVVPPGMISDLVGTLMSGPPICSPILNVCTAERQKEATAESHRFQVRHGLVEVVRVAVIVAKAYCRVRLIRPLPF